tara:strand:+ start:77 stop:997 length:921 start_codon:yes stop_codon:yes gene_type:complete
MLSKKIVLDFEQEISPKKIFSLIILNRLFIFLIFLTFSISGAIYSLLIPNSYLSESVYSTEEAQITSQPSLGGLGGLAGFVGLDLGGPTNKASMAIELINSRAFFRSLIEENKILKKIYAAKKFDQVSNEIIFDNNLLDSNGEWKKNKKPSYLKAYKSFQSALSISINPETGFIELSYEHVSPIFASDIIELIVKKANSYLRKRDIESSEEALTFLRDQVRQEVVVSVKNSIGKLIESQLEKLMVAQISKEYYLKKIEPPFIPEVKSNPRRSLIVFMSGLISLLFSLTFIFIREFILFSRKREADV